VLPEVPMAESITETSAIVATGDSSKATALESVKHTAGMLRLSIEAPVQQAKWAENLAGRVAWMVMNNQTSAQISLNPAELGPIEVKVSLQNDQTSVNFYAHNNAVREAIEDAFPRLRDMLSENGLNLSQSSVSDQSLSQKENYSETAQQQLSRYPFKEEGRPVAGNVDEQINIKLGLVDHYV
jgi:flagellar hook-length control protein FliK